MQKNYYVKYGFWKNEYRLMWSYKNTMPHWEKISFNEGKRLCKEENQRRKTDSNFSGYADRFIYPEGFTDADVYDWLCGRYWTVYNTYVIERKKRVDKIIKA